MVLVRTLTLIGDGEHFAFRWDRRCACPIDLYNFNFRRCGGADSGARSHVLQTINHRSVHLTLHKCSVVKKPTSESGEPATTDQTDVHNGQRRNDELCNPRRVLLSRTIFRAAVVLQLLPSLLESRTFSRSQGRLQGHRNSLPLEICTRRPHRRAPRRARKRKWSSGVLDFHWQRSFVTGERMDLVVVVSACRRLSAPSQVINNEFLAKSHSAVTTTMSSSMMCPKLAVPAPGAHNYLRQEHPRNMVRLQ